MKTHRRLILSTTVAVLAALLLPLAVSAHPLGNFTINRYSRLELSADRVRVRYIVDMAEIPAFQAQQRIDANADGTLDDAEREAYLAAELAALAGNLQLSLNGRSIALQPGLHTLEFPAGQGGLSTLRLSVWLEAAVPPATAWQLEYEDKNFAGRLGWQEIVVAADQMSLLASDVSTADRSHELRDYPADLLQSPPTVNRASIRFAPLTASLSVTPTSKPASITAPTPGRAADQFAELIALPELSLSAMLAALLGALVWGAAHAFSPGHGKTIVAAYLVGSRATARHALFLGLTTTLTHTAGVFALGLITLFAAQYVVPEQLFPWLEAISGGLVIAIGGSLFVNRLRKLTRRESDRHAHDHAHDHVHDHTHDHDHHHDHSSLVTRHSHLPPGTDGAPVSWRSLLALGISGGLLPCPSALVVMLGAIALNRVAFGLVLIVVFSAGLAGTLTAIGLVLVRAKSLIERLSAGGRLFGRIPINRRLIQVLPAVSALFIMLAGLGITLTALAALN